MFQLKFISMNNIRCYFIIAHMHSASIKSTLTVLESRLRCFSKNRLYTVMALFFTGRYFHKFHEKPAVCENIIVNSYASFVLLQLYILAS